MSVSDIRRPRLLMIAAAHLVAEGGGKVRPLATAIEAESKLDEARRAATATPNWAAHVQALADLIVSAQADRAAKAAA